MDEFSVLLNELGNASNSEKNYSVRLKGLAGEVGDVKRGLSRYSQYSGVISAVNRIENKFNTLSTSMGQFSDKTSSIKTIYTKTEQEVSGVSKYDNILGAIGAVIGSGIANISSIDFSKFTDVMKDLFPYATSAAAILGFADALSDDLTAKYKHKLYEYKDKNEVKVEYEYDPETKKWNKKEKKDGKDKDKKLSKKDVLENVTLWKAKVGDSASLYSESADGDNYHLQADFLKAEWSSEAAVTAGCVTGTIGAGFVLAHAEASGKLGDDNLGIHGGVTSDIGKAEAKANAKLGFLDEKGNFNPSLSAKVSAEAVAAKVGGNVGLDIAGADVDVKGSVGVGVGAHASVGFDNGKLSFSAGAYLGVGGDINLEIDLSGAAENVGKAVGAVGDAVGQAASVVGNAVGEAANAVGNAVSDWGKGLGRAFSKWW